MGVFDREIPEAGISTTDIFDPTDIFSRLGKLVGLITYINLKRYQDKDVFGISWQPLPDGKTMRFFLIFSEHPRESPTKRWKAFSPTQRKVAFDAHIGHAQKEYEERNLFCENYPRGKGQYAGCTGKWSKHWALYPEGDHYYPECDLYNK